MTSFIGLTWDHPRGFDALAAAARAAAVKGEVRIIWEKQSLAGFEEHPIEELCAAYDLVVLDHPHIGEAVRRNCLRPLEEVFDDEALARISIDTIGACLRSYRYAGKHWALPLDAAAQVMAFRPDLLEAAPRDWDEVAEAATRVPTVLSLAGPHAALTLFSIALSISDELAVGGRLFPPDVGERAFDCMRTIFARSSTAGRAESPIGILETMAETNDIALCPLVFGYVNYARPPIDSGAKPLVFVEAPLMPGTERRGSILGGTGIGITSRCQVAPELLAHLKWLMSVDAQIRFIPNHNGQPSARAAWTDEAVNGRWRNFYRNTIATLEDAHVRPRYEGYIAFQKIASASIREALETRLATSAVIAALESAYVESRPQVQER